MRYLDIHAVVEGIFPSVVFVSNFFRTVTLLCVEEMNF